MGFFTSPLVETLNSIIIVVGLVALAHHAHRRRVRRNFIRRWSKAALPSDSPIIPIERELN